MLHLATEVLIKVKREVPYNYSASRLFGERSDRGRMRSSRASFEVLEALPNGPCRVIFGVTMSFRVIFLPHRARHKESWIKNCIAQSSLRLVFDDALALSWNMLELSRRHVQAWLERYNSYSFSIDCISEILYTPNTNQTIHPTHHRRHPTQHRNTRGPIYMAMPPSGTNSLPLTVPVFRSPSIYSYNKCVHSLFITNERMR